MTRSVRVATGIAGAVLLAASALDQEFVWVQLTRRR